MNIRKLIELLEEVEKEHPDAEVYIDPPFNPVMTTFYRENENVVELHH